MAYGQYGMKLAEAATMIYGAGKAIGALGEAEAMAGACKGECFVAGTLVSFAHVDKAGQWQPVLRPIETAQAGEPVLTRDPVTGKNEVKRIVSTSHSYVDATVTVTLAEAKSGRVVETITGTRRHPFFVEGKGFVPAGGLAIGNSIVTRAGPALIVKSVTWNRRAEGYDVFNFVVEDDHSYFVGKANGGAWVHNADVCNLTRGATDIDNLKHYIWESPDAGKFDLMLDAQSEGGTLTIHEGHIMPVDGSFAATSGKVGMKGIRQLQRDLGQYFGSDTISIPKRIGRTTGGRGYFGPGTYRLR